MPRVPKLDHAMAATIARRTVRAGTKVLALLLPVVLPLLLVVEVLGSIVLQLFVVHLERSGVMGLLARNKHTLTGQHRYCHLPFPALHGSQCIGRLWCSSRGPRW